MKIWMALAAGLLFGLGLSLGGMTQPAAVIGFLDIFGAWDPRLAFVMGASVLTTAVGYRWVLRRPRPLLESHFRMPTLRRPDIRLIGGSVMFGIGWGIAGYCPGPAIASISGGGSLLLLVATMALGWWLAARWQPRSGKL
jgi:uncharacterized protein